MSTIKVMKTMQKHKNIIKKILTFLWVSYSFGNIVINELERIPNVTKYLILFTNFLIGYNPEKYGYYYQIQSAWLKLTYCVASNLHP